MNSVGLPGEVSRDLSPGPPESKEELVIGDAEAYLPDDLQITHAAFFKAFHDQPSTHWVRNVQTDWLQLHVGACILPVTVNGTEYQNSWVASPYNAMVTYALEELRNISSRSMRTALAAIIHSVAPLLRASSINKVVCVNNWLLSTNLYPAWNGEGLHDLVSQLTHRFPDHVIMFRSLNAISNAELMEKLRESGFMLAPSRQVYLCDNPNAALKKQNHQIDLRLLRRKTDYQITEHSQLTADDDNRIVDLYNQLYLTRYSTNNPQFTPELVRLWRETGLLKLIGLRSPSGRLDGIVGCLGNDSWITTPLLGYQTSLPQQLGLYRMLTTLVFLEAHRTQRMLNLSSGAAGFKRHRGGVASIEYSAIYCRHLPLQRQAVWHCLNMLLRQVGVRVLESWQL